RLAGAEAFVRARHPVHGALPPECFLRGAAEADLALLTRQVLVQTMRHWPELARVSPDLKLSINVPLHVLSNLPFREIVAAERPHDSRWPGIILEITEDEAVPSIAEVARLAAQLAPLGLRLSLDNCGAAYAGIARLAQIPFCELKIDRSF